jgi:hypothetical protein
VTRAVQGPMRPLVGLLAGHATCFALLRLGDERTAWRVFAGKRDARGAVLYCVYPAAMVLAAFSTAMLITQ